MDYEFSPEQDARVRDDEFSRPPASKRRRFSSPQPSCYVDLDSEGVVQSIEQSDSQGLRPTASTFQQRLTHSTEAFTSDRRSSCQQVTLRQSQPLALKSSYPSLPAESTISKEILHGTEQGLLCFGMITGIQGKYRPANKLQSSVSQLAELTSPDSFRLPSSPKTIGSLAEETRSLIQSFLEEPTLQLQVFCKPRAKHASISPQWVPCHLNIILYGPSDLFEDIGYFLQQHSYHLQRPQSCNRNVPYRNPHTLAAEDAPPYPMTFDIENVEPTCQIQIIPSQCDLLDSLVTEEEFEEAQQPSAVQTLLNRHQRQALTFLKRRERGWNMIGSVPDIWKMVHMSGKQVFMNRITKCHQMERPKEFCGGILADPMGLGKTLTVMSLIATDLDDIQNILYQSYVRLTLVIVPPSLLSTWNEQLSEHLAPGELSCQLHHAKSRLSGATDLSSPGVVLTTYQTVASEYKNNVGQSILLKTFWHRIIIDEAHCIRNPLSHMTKAICALQARSRWAVTGTPLQNRLSDVASLLSFLRVDPYDKPGTFETDIVAVWKHGNAKEALERLKKMMRCLLLRRTKTVIQIPPRTDLVCVLEFRPEEHALYRNTHVQAVKLVEEALLQASTASRVYLNALQQIDMLRRICNMGTHYNSTKKSRSSTPASDWEPMAQQSFDYLVEFGDAVCHFCAMGVDMAEEESFTDVNDSQPWIFRCLRIMCSTCSQKRVMRFESKCCGHEPPCHIAKVKIDDRDEETSRPLKIPSSHQPLPTKIQALLAQLKGTEWNTKRQVQ